MSLSFTLSDDALCAIGVCPKCGGKLHYGATDLDEMGLRNYDVWCDCGWGGHEQYMEVFVGVVGIK